MAHQLTPDEQIRLVNGKTFFGTADLPQHQIPRLQMLDGGTGINFEQLFGDFLSQAGRTGIGSDALRAVLADFFTPDALTDAEARDLYEWILAELERRVPNWTAPGCYPPGMLLGATWNPEVIDAVGCALGQEARAYGVNVLLGTPNVNLHRDPRNGRLFEGYSEDPYLVAHLAPALVRGVQAQGVAANVKHFAANHQETNRLNIDEHISERALQELYYPAFHACVDAGVATVMSAYNQINGVPCTENEALLIDTLRKDWGFSGLVMSDWGAVYHPAAAINAGNDLAMPGPIAPDAMRAAYEDGSVSHECLQRAAARVEALAAAYAKPAEGTIDQTATNRAAYDAAAEGIVLLKNDAETLPLAHTAQIALFGEYAETLCTCGGGSAGIHTTRNANFRQALVQRFSGVFGTMMANTDTLMIVYTLTGREGKDRTSLEIPASVATEWRSLLAEAADKALRTILVLNVSAPVILGEFADTFSAILCVFLPGMQGANALADCLSGAVNPSGKLPLTWPKRLQDTPTYLHFPGDGMQVQYGEGIFVGYRWYDTRDIAPLYPFGHGLSYTHFAILSLTTSSSTFKDALTVSVTVQNTGLRAGKTVVQLYISDSHATLTKPLRELKAFEKIALAPGAQTTITFPLSANSFQSYDPNRQMWTFEEGYYTLSTGFSSRDLQAEATVYADVTSPYSYGAQTSILEIMTTLPLRDCVFSFFEAHRLPWAVVLNCYDYTAQDTIEKALDIADCPADTRPALYQAMKAVQKQ